MSASRRAQERELQDEVTREESQGGTFWRKYLARVGRERVTDWWVVHDVAAALREIHLNRWRAEPEVAEAVREARAALAKLARIMSSARDI